MLALAQENVVYAVSYIIKGVFDVGMVMTKYLPLSPPPKNILYDTAIVIVIVLE